MFFFSKYSCTLCKNEESEIPVCKKCEKTLLESLNHLSPCTLDGTVIKNIDEVYAFFPYKNEYRQLITMWKFQNERTLSPFFAGLFDKAFQNYFDENNTYQIVPIPPRKGKIWKQGWDQMDETANFLQFLYNRKIYKALQRRKSTEKKTQSRQERIKNLQKSYYLNKDFNLKGKNICLIDDILTTGSTLEGAAEALKNAGAKKIIAIVLCRA